MTKIHTEHCKVEQTTPEQPSRGIIVEPEFVGFLRSNGYTVRGVNQVHTVESNSRDVGHIIMEVETYRFSKDNPMLDVANPDHQVTIWVCGCEDFRYNQSVDVSKQDKEPSMVEPCRHITACSMVEKARNDDSQETLL